MSLPLTPVMMVGAYVYLRTTPPFRRWGLPAADEVRFKVTYHSDREGDCQAHGDGFIIRASIHMIGHTDSLMKLIAHEMVHIYQFQRGVRSLHNKEYRRLAKLVCKYHGWDERLFVGA